jgi:hypothetical protein
MVTGGSTFAVLVEGFLLADNNPLLPEPGFLPLGSEAAMNAPPT